MDKRMWRVMDANVNRASEGLRVVEDLARFRYNHAALSERIKQLRHQIRTILESTLLISGRDVKNDMGSKTSLSYAELPHGSDETSDTLPPPCPPLQGEPQGGSAPLVHSSLHLSGHGSSVRPDERLCELDLIHANFKRVQESLRVLEEISKVEVRYGVGKSFERLRFELYQIESDYHHKLWQLKFVQGIYGITHDISSSDPLDAPLYPIAVSRPAMPVNPDKRDDLLCHIDQIRRMVRCGIEVVQLREKSSKPMPEEVKREFRALSREIRGQGVIFIVNDNWRLALELEASGVHLGQEDLRGVDITQIPEELLIGISTHNPEQVASAIALGADYIGVGPIFETRTKKNVEKSDGLRFLKWVSEHAGIPYVAIGGIEVKRLPELRENGLTIAAMISAISGATSDSRLRELVEQFRRRSG